MHFKQLVALKKKSFFYNFGRVSGFRRRRREKMLRLKVPLIKNSICYIENMFFGHHPNFEISIGKFRISIKIPNFVLKNQITSTNYHYMQAEKIYFFAYTKYANIKHFSCLRPPSMKNL